MSDLWTIRNLDSCASTNVEARAWISDGCGPRSVVAAREQSEGRGRLGRQWHSPAGENLYASAIFPAPLPVEKVSLVTLLAANVIADALELMTGSKIETKWPNDLLCSGKKLVGVLTELVESPEGNPTVILGFGVNVNTLQFPPDLEGKAISMAQVSGQEFDVQSVLSGILRELDRRLRKAHEDGGVDLEAWKARMVPGRSVRVMEPNRSYVGIAEGIDARGALRVRVGEEIRTVLAGDVVPVEWGE